jgi:4-hydroxy-tetrahydrodipicolinate synthase
MVEQFRGTTVALITPFDDNGEVDRARLRNLVDWQIEKGTDVILTCGTTGESATLSHDEHHEVMNIVIDQVAKRVPVLCGAGSNATHEAISLSQHAEKAGASAILSVAPYYNKPTQDGLYQHFKSIAEAVNIPVILYNVPGRTSCNINAPTVLRLAEVPNIIGVKEASGDMNQIMAILKGRPKDFLVLSGDDALTLPMLSLGADGVMSVVANEAPGLLHDMVHSAFDGAWDKARALHYKLLPLMNFNFVETNPIPVKTAVYLMGLVKHNFRLPLVKMSELNTKKMASLLKQLDLI